MEGVSRLHENLSAEEIDWLRRNHCELLGIKAILSSQTYGPVEANCRQHLNRNIMHAANHGLTWIGDVSRDRVGYGAARNGACEDLMEQEDVHGIMWVDSDIQAPSDAISRLIFTARVYGLDFVSGVYHHRGGDFQPVFYDWYVPTLQERWFKGRRDGFVQCDVYPMKAIAPKAGCGFGFVWTSRRLIEAVKWHPDWREKHGAWFPDTRDSSAGFGEDLSFCKFARDIGIQLYVDTGIQVGHTGDPEVIGIERFNQRRMEIIEEAKRAVE